jgi:MFS family permease
MTGRLLDRGQMLAHAGDDQGPRLAIEVDSRPSRRTATGLDPSRRQLRRHARRDRIRESVEPRSEATTTLGNRPCDAIDVVPSESNDTPPIGRHALPHNGTMPRRVSARKRTCPLQRRAPCSQPRRLGKRPRGMLTQNLGLYLTSRFFSATAMMMLRAAVAWHVFALSHSAFHLGLIGLVQFVPVVSLMLVGGALADTYDRRAIMMAAQAIPLTCGCVLFLATRAGVTSLPLLYAVVFLAGVAWAFDSPSRAAILPTLVSRAAFPRAVTIASTNQALAFTTGPAIGGLVIAAAGVGAVYAVHVVCIAIALLALVGLRTERPAGMRARVSLRAIREGLGFVRRQPVILGCMTLDMFAVIFGGAAALLPIYATEILGGGARGYGLLTSSLELGALLMAFVLMALPPIRRAGPALLIAVGVYGLATIGFGLSRWFPLSVATYMLVGMADQVSVVMRSTAIQLSTPDPLRGRVSSVNMIFIGASNQLGAAESGFVAALTSAPVSVVSGGLACLLVLAVVATTLPQLWRYRTDAPAPAG